MVRIARDVFWLYLLGATALFAANLSPLAQKPQWSVLEKFQETIPHDDFVSLLQNVYATRGYGDLIQISDDSARIVEDAGAGTFFTLRFAGARPHKMPPRYWRAIDKLPAATEQKPLRRLRVALDPGHIGDGWAKMEERWFQVGDSKPVMEGEMTLLTAKILAARLRELGASVSFVRRKNTPTTPQRPDDLHEIARTVLQQQGVMNPAETYVNADDPAKGQTLQWQSELLFYRQSEIRYRGRRVNDVLRPDLVLCLHFNAEEWGDPKAPTLIDKNHFHVLVNGAYLPEELAHDDIRFEMLRKLLARTSDEELSLAEKMADVFARETKLPHYEYTQPTVTKTGASGYVYLRNLLATRVYRCPVVYFEPYVMNSNEVFARVQAGDYEGSREIGGVLRPSIFREYAQAVADGLAQYCRTVRNADAPFCSGGL